MVVICYFILFVFFLPSEILLYYGLQEFFLLLLLIIILKYECWLGLLLYEKLQSSHIKFLFSHIYIFDINFNKFYKNNLSGGLRRFVVYNFHI